MDRQVSFTLDANESSSAIVHGGGIISAMLARTAGSMTVTLQWSLNGTDWYTYRGADGQAREADLDGTTTTAHLVTDPVQVGVQFRVTGSNNSSGNIVGDLSRAVWK